MPKTKRGPALFEVLGEDLRQDAAGHLKIPEWWAKGKPPRLGEGDVCPDRPKTVVADKPRPVASVPSSVGTKPRWVVVDGDRLSISLTSLSAAVVLFCGLVFVLGAYEWGSRSGARAGFQAGFEQGRTSYEARTADEIELARSRPPTTELVNSLLVGAEELPVGPRETPAESGEALPAPQWIRDHTYIVAQEFSKGRAEDAARAKAFLAQHGIATEQMTQRGGSIQLITVRGFNHKDASQKKMSEQLLARVHEVGGKFYATGGGYRLQGYFKTLKGDSW